MRSPINIIKNILGKLHLLTAIILLVIACLVSFARFYTPILKKYQPDIAAWASDYLKHPVEIGEMHAYWSHFEPVLNFSDVTVLNPKKSRTLLQIKDLRIEIAVLRSITQRQLVISKLYINGVDITAVQQKNGKWYIKGFKSTDTDTEPNADSMNEVAAWLMTQPEIALQDISITLKQNNDVIHSLNKLNFILKNNGKNHILRGVAGVDTDSNPNIHVAVDLSGSENDIQKVQGQWYISTHQLELNKILQGISLAKLSFLDGTLDTQVWGSIDNEKISNIQAHIALENAELQGDANSPIIVDKLNANLLWDKLENNEQGWELSGNHIELVLNHHPWELSRFEIWMAQQPNNIHQTIVEFKTVELADLYSLLTTSSILPNTIRDKWRKLDPHGVINNFQLQYQTQPNQSDLYNVHFDFVNMGVAPFESNPGVTGLVGDVAVDNDTGIVHLTTNQSIIDLTHIFPEKFMLNQLTGTVQWQKTNDSLDIQGLNINMADQNLHVQTNFDLQIPHDNTSPYLRLLGQLQEKNIGQFKNYLPTKALPANLSTWLNQAFVAGKGVDAGFVLNGRLDHYPFPDYSGRYLVSANVDDMQFNYAPQWGMLTDLSGDLTFDQDNLNFNLHSGNIAEQSISSLSAKILGMHKDNPYLSIITKIPRADMKEVQAFLLASPLQSNLDALNDMALSGNADLDLNLSIPLNDGDTQAQGKINFNNSALAIPGFNLNFEKIKGEFDFNNEILTAPHISASLMNHPAQINIKTIYQNKVPVKLFSLKSDINVGDLTPYFKIPSLKWMEGQTSYQANLKIMPQASYLKLNSDLVGVKLNLPAPYAKAADIKMPLTINITVPQNKPVLLGAHYNDINTMLMLNKKDNETTIEKGIIQLNNKPAVLPDSSILLVKGNLSNFVWDEWTSVFQPFSTGDNGSALKSVFQIYFGRVSVKNYSLTQAHINAEKSSKAWDVKINSDQLTGTLSVPTDYKKQPIIGNFKKLILEKNNSVKSSEQSDIQPKDLVPLNFTIDDFKYGKKDFGSVALKLSNNDTTVNLQELKISNPLYDLESTGKWTIESDSQSTFFKGQANIKNLGELLKQEDLTNHISKGAGSFIFDLSWPGSPAAFDIKKIKGTIGTTIQSGAIVGMDEQMNKKVGLGKLINAFSVESLTKRLTFNFKDDQLDFDKLQGDFTINSAKLTTDNFFIDSEIAKIYADGQLSLDPETYNINLKMTPYLTSSLPLIATIAGGPIIGAATWAASKVVQMGVDNVVVYHYHIGGTWDNPVISSGDDAVKTAQANASQKS